jgi:hypothetical protein
MLKGDETPAIEKEIVTKDIMGVPEMAPQTASAPSHDYD